jgi:hypothetical protein
LLSLGSKLFRLIFQDGTVRSLYWSTGAVGHDNLSGTAGAPKAAGDPVGYYAAAYDTHNVIYRTGDGHLHSLYWVGVTPVIYGGNLTWAISAPPAAGDPTAFVNAAGVNIIIYRSVQGDILSLYWADGPSGLDNLSSVAGTPLAAGDPVAYYPAHNDDTGGELAKPACRRWSQPRHMRGCGPFRTIRHQYPHATMSRQPPGTHYRGTRVTAGSYCGGLGMLNLTTLLIEPFVRRLQHTYHQMYGCLEPDYPGLLDWAGRMALEQIATSDALYHTVEHTILVTLVGQDMLIGKQYHDGDVTPRDWLHVMVALLCHDIGYVRGVC